MDEELDTWAKIKALATGIYRIWIGERPGPLAASLAYYAVFSIVPVTYVATLIAGIFFDASELTVRLEDRLEELLGPEAVDQFSNALDALADSTTKGTTLATVISVIVLLFTASLIFFQLQYVLNNVWKAPPPSRDETRNYVRNRLLAFVMVLSVGFILILATAANIIVSIVTSITSFEGILIFANFVVYGLLLMLALAMIYKFLPNVEIAWRDVWVGSAVTAVLILVALQVVGLLINLNKFNTALQAAGSAALFLMSFYFLGTIFVFGAVFTRVYATIFGSHIKPREEMSANDKEDE